MINVYVWRFRGSSVAWGHASMQVQGEYISWWPAQPRTKAFPYFVPDVYSAPPRPNQSHLEVQCLENEEFPITELDGNRCVGRRSSRSPPVPARLVRPDFTISLDGLDEFAIVRWWRKFNIPGASWSTLGQNCSTTVARALMAGGADDYVEGFSDWLDTWNLVWTPEDVHQYALSIRRGLEHHFAKKFINRFCVGTTFVGATITFNMDEDGLAAAIYKEAGASERKTYMIFRELYKNHSSDVDDVAELYANLLKQKKGPPRDAVSHSERLRTLLIKSLDKGWTSSGESAAIAFLKGLGSLEKSVKS
jgi:hypothetical protein